MDLHSSEHPISGDAIDPRDADLVQDNGRADASPGGRGVTRVMLPDASGVVTLPAGTELSDIRVEGRDLVIIGADGIRYVIPDGAILVPELVIDDVAIPPLNLAALLVGNEPQPAAGAAQSSGGNFASPVGPLQGAYGLGDLLPYTELTFPQDEEREIIPARPDRDPEVFVVTPDQPAGASAATALVFEAGLPVRGNEPAGTNSAATSETTTGTIVFDAPDGLAGVTIGGTAITAVGQTIVGTNGTLTITSIAPGVIGYSYTLADNLVGQTLGDSFEVRVTDVDNDVATATLTVSVQDDAPIANNDTDSVAAGTYGPETGNVMTGAGTTSGAPGADQQGADGATLTAVSGFGGNDSSFDGMGNLVVQGQYGTLSIKADGSYSFVRTPGTAGGVTDSFTYTLTDSDGSSDTAILTISIGDSPASVVSLPTTGAGTVVDEAGLPPRPSEAPGTAEPTPVESTSGTITVAAPDGIASVQIGNVVVTGPGQNITLPEGVLTVTSYDPTTGTITYTFTLVDNTAGDSTTVVVPVTVTDVDGDSDTKNLTITIIDDAPVAVDDAATQATENSPVTVKVLANDVQGADSVQPGTVTLVGGSLSGTGVLINNGDGSFTYTPGPGEQGTVTFGYSITDGDGDTSTAQVTITLLSDSIPTVAINGDTDVLEAGLPARGGEPAGSQAAGNGEFAAGTIAITSGGDTIASLTVNGTDVTGGGAVSTSKGTLTVTSDGAGGYSYSYQLTDNTLVEPDSDSFALKITDSDGSIATATLTIAIIDDQPSAIDDAAALAAGSYGPIGGNVLTNDTQGADSAAVASYAGSGPAVATGGVAIGAYGTLTIAADGTFSYTRDPGSAGGVTDSFTYTIRDGDGDLATATLAITIPDSQTSLDVPAAGEAGTTVLEEALATGSNPSSTAEATSGTISFAAPDGPAILTIDGQPAVAGAIIAGAFGTIQVDSVANGVIAYTYTLTTNTNGDNTSDSFTIRIEDQDGDFTESDLVVSIVDDVPTARPDTDTVTEDGPLTATGNVITDAEANGDAGADTPGADGAGVTGFSGAGGAGAAGATIGGLYGTLTLNADGSYTYALNNANPLVQGLDSTESLTDSFAYTIEDGDGDPSSSTLTITIAGDDDGITITGLNLGAPELTFDEDDLALGSSPDAALLTKSGTFVVVAQDGIVTIEIGGKTIYSGGDFVAGQSIATAYGTLTFTGVAEDVTDAGGDVTQATVSYSYTLTTNTLTHVGPTDAELIDSYTITVTDTDNTVASDTLEIKVIDDVPAAANDTVTQPSENNAFVIDALANDTFGADRVDTANPAKVFVSSDAAQGTVTYDPATGQFTYSPNAGAGAVTTSDSFQYTIVDRDGDTSTATVNVTLQPDSKPTGGTVTATVDDDGVTGGNSASTVGDLDANQGDNPADTSEASFTGTLQFNVFNDSPATIAFAAGMDGTTTTVGLETVQFHVVGNVLTAQITSGARTGTDLFEVEILDSATGEYQVRLLTNVLNAGGPNDEAIDATTGITFQVTDADSSTVTTNLSIVFDDDAPTATSNSGVVTEGGSTGGNVLSDGVADAFGADGGRILSITSGGTTVAPGATIETSLGFLTVGADGSYTYVSKANSTNTDATDTFSYTIVDGDGDTATAQLAISVDNVSGNVSDSDVNVNEAGLGTATSTGSNAASNSEIGTGSITVNGAAGPFTYTLVGANSSGDGTYGTLVLDGATGTYTYTLDTPFTDSVTENSANIVNGAESFNYEVRDSLNNLIGSGSIAVNITDDVPNAVDEPARAVAEDAVGTIGGNVLANDTPGADGATVTHVNVGGGLVLLTSGTALGGGVFGFTTANGTYTFTASGAWTFDPKAGLDQSAGPVNASFSYRLTDGDGDFDDATQPITITDGAGPANPGNVTLNLDDQLLADGRTPAATQPPTDSETITFVPGSDPFASIVFGSIAGLGGGLTWTKSADGLSITGTQGGQLVVTLTLEVTGNTAKVIATLNDNYLHTDGLGDQNAAFGSVEVVATDIDGDKATALAALEISDDLPTLAATAPAANSLTVDETVLATNATVNFAGLFTPDYNADGPGTVGNYTLGIKAEGADTGLVDTLSGQKVVLHFDGTKVVGWTEISHVTVFEVTVSGSSVTLDQQRSVVHANAANPNDATPALAADLITLTATVTDADKDTATATANIGAAIRFLDDGPTAVNDANTIDEDGTTVAGNVVLGNDNTANTADDDNFGADGPAAAPVTAISGFVGAGTVGGTTIGEFGSLTLNANGTYTYTVDTSKTQFLDAGESETDTFTYTIKDGDGDATTATLTITITGSNDAPIARADTNWTIEDAAAAITGNVLANVPHTKDVPGDFADVADTDIDDAVTVQNPGVIVGAYGTLTLNADGSYSYALNNANGQVQALGVGDAPLVDTFNYTATDGTTGAASTLKISIFGANDAPSLVASTATVSDEGFAAGNKDSVGTPTDVSNSTTFLTGNLTITDKDLTDTFTVTIGTPAPNPAIRIADGSATGTALTWSVIDGGKTLVGYVSSAADPSVVVKVTDSGSYTVEIFDPIFHPNTTVEDIVSNLVIPVTVTDDSGSANASTTLANAITVVFEDDSPTLGAFSPAANTVSNASAATAVGTFAYSPGGDGHGSFTIAGPAIDGVIYKPLVNGLIDISDDGVSNPVQGTTLTATTADGLTTLFTMQVDSTGNYKFTLVTADASTSETLSFKSLSAGGPGFRELDDDPSTPVNENGRVEFTSNGSGVNANNNDFGVSNSFVDPDEFFTMEFHSPGADGDQLASDNPDFLSAIDIIVNTLQGSGGRNGPGQSGGPNVTLRWTAFNTATGETETGTVTVTSTGLAHIDPTIEFNQMKVENVDLPGSGTDGGRIQIGGVQIFKVILPQDETIDFTLTAKDADGDTTTVSNVSIFIDATPPIALDLDGDGVEFLSLAAGVSYDYGAGAVGTAWVAPDDGLLARSTGAGLDLVFTDDAPGAFTDLQGLRLAYDSNGDGQLTADDAEWSSFGVWSDANSDGVVDAGEFASLDAVGITAIGLHSDGQAYTAAGGDVRVSGTASFTRADGSTGAVADAVFATDARNNQRTAEIVATAAVAGAVLDAASAAAALPAAASDHAVQALPATQYTRVALEAESTAPDAAIADQLHQQSMAFRPVEADYRATPSDTAEFAALDEPADRGSGPLNHAVIEAGPHEAMHPSLFGNAGQEGLMQAILAVAPVAAPSVAAGDGTEPAQAAIGEALADYSGAKLIDTIVDHFTTGDGPAIGLAANDAGSSMLAQALGGQSAIAAFHDAMSAMPDADALALATPHA